MDAVDLARRFALGGAAGLSDGPVARGKQGVVWRLDTADGSWAVKDGRQVRMYEWVDLHPPDLRWPVGRSA